MNNYYLDVKFLDQSQDKVTDKVIEPVPLHQFGENSISR